MKDAMARDQKNPEDLRVDDQTIETLCNHCGQTFSTFLHQMAEQNAKVTCPACGKEHEHTPLPKTGRPIRER